MEFDCKRCGSTIGYAADLCERCVQVAARRKLAREIKRRHPEPSPYVTDDERQIPLWPIPDGPAYLGGPAVHLFEDAQGQRYTDPNDVRFTAPPLPSAPRIPEFEDNGEVADFADESKEERELGRPDPPPVSFAQLDPRKVAKARKLRAEGKTFREIANRVAWSVSTVHRVAKGGES